jgi:pimeloyl-ACP methyl ester carboxylesterase
MEKVRSADGTLIAFERSGSGPAVIVVEGAFCDRGTSAPLAALLAPHFTVFAYDRRGRGDSGDMAPYAVEREIEDLDALIAAAGGSASAYGMSSGAVLALEAAARGSAITRLALYEPPLIPGRPDFAARLAELVAAGRKGDAAEYFMTQAVGIAGEVVAQIRQAPMWPGMERIAPTLVYDTTITRDASFLAERAPAVTVPALVIDGAQSPAVLRQAARATADALPHGRYRTLAGQTHDVSPDVLAKVLEEFFAAH